MNCKDKTNVPGYLRYRDHEFMYFPEKEFFPLLREVDTVVKTVVNFNGLKQEGDNLIKVFFLHINMLQLCSCITTLICVFYRLLMKDYKGKVKDSWQYLNQL